MNDLIEALTILAKYQKAGVDSPTHCEHDVLTVVDIEQEVSDKDEARLEELGFFQSDEDEDEDCWISFRFGKA